MLFEISKVGFCKVLRRYIVNKYMVGGVLNDLAGENIVDTFYYTGQKGWAELPSGRSLQHVGDPAAYGFYDFELSAARACGI